MLDVQDLYGGYGKASVLSGTSLLVKGGEIVALMGRAGSGKSTLLKAVMGLVRSTSGTIRMRGRNITRQSPHHRAALGLGYVPEERRLFAGLTVHEHFLAATRPGPITPLQIYRFFPALANRRHQSLHSLSASERQMLAIGRAVSTNPQILLVDRATEGLSSAARRDILRILGKLREMGMGMMVVDMHLEELRYMADRFLVLEKGLIAFEADRAQILMAPERLERFVAI